MSIARLGLGVHGVEAHVPVDGGGRLGAQILALVWMSATVEIKHNPVP
jgi:hypothetical protein